MEPPPLPPDAKGSTGPPIPRWLCVHHTLAGLASSGSPLTPSRASPELHQTLKMNQFGLPFRPFSPQCQNVDFGDPSHTFASSRRSQMVPFWAPFPRFLAAPHFGCLLERFWRYKSDPRALPERQEAPKGTPEASKMTPASLPGGRVGAK